MVSERDKAYMRRLGEAKARAHADRLAEHLSLPIAERLRRSLALWRQFHATANLAARDDDPTAFYDRARRLGLYES